MTDEQKNQFKRQVVIPEIFKNIISVDAVYNILMHCRKCWDYTYPTGNALEEAIYRGLKPFYTDAQSLGAPNTIVDVSKQKDAFDVKGGKKIKHMKRITTSANYKENMFVDQILPNSHVVTVQIPKHLTTMVQRPNIDMKNWRGDPFDIIKKCVQYYKRFAEITTKKANCDNLFSIVVLYGEHNGYRSIFMTLEEFSSPEIVTADLHLKKDGKKAGYIGYDAAGNIVYSLYPFNRGSVNSHKRFETNKGVLYTWPIKEDHPVIYNESDLVKDGSIEFVN